jgi:DNA-binding NtrC family response regulator
MKPIKTILIADRNPRILAYLKRELSTEGYCIHTVENSHQLHHWIHQKALDLFIIDPDLFRDGDSCDWLSICRSLAPLPIILHGLPSEYPSRWNELNPVQYIYKSGTSIEQLKEAIKETVGPEDEGTPRQDQTASDTGYRLPSR